ncbi:MAG: bifunctional folylpolyglutamate synthase/dihydrofolate synthase [bacterium]
MCKNDTIKFFDGLHRFGWRLGLVNISKLLADMGNPHETFPSIHIAGTNGKGSTAAMIESIVSEAGYKTGLFTSPHLCHFTERIKINAVPVSLSTFVDVLQKIKPKVEEYGCTYFEVMTAIAFQCFADSEVDLAIVEVGLGGRFDATNVIRPLLSVITNIDLDHTEHLGQTKRMIAAEKAGIIKPHIPCLCGVEDAESKSVILEQARVTGSKFVQLDELCQVTIDEVDEKYSIANLKLTNRVLEEVKIALATEHQIRNAAMAVTAVSLLAEKIVFTDEHVRAGLQNVQWAGRFQIWSEAPKIILDVAHNLPSIIRLIAALKSFYEDRRLIFVLGMLQDKNYRDIAKQIAAIAYYTVVVSPQADRALSVLHLGEEMAKHTSSFLICERMQEAFSLVKSVSSENNVICVTGSHYTVGEFINFYKNA